MSRQDPLIGRTIRDSIVLEAAIGDGGMGRVYRGVDKKLSRVVAVKVLRPDHKDVETARVYFEREARAASKLWHPNIIQIIDFGSEPDGTLYLVMEYVPGRNLADVLEQDFPLSTARIVRILAQLLTALEEAHNHGVIHRDLKPENIMLQDVPGNPDFVKVLDFGVAKAIGVDKAGPMTIQGLVLGTPHFMSPEQALGHEIDARSDLYSVGAILYQVLTCDLPFDGQLVMNVLARVITERPIPPGERRPSYPIDPRLDRICMRAMRKNVEGRFQNAAEFRTALLEILAEDEEHASSGNWPAARSSPRHAAPVVEVPVELPRTPTPRPAPRAPQRIEAEPESLLEDLPVPSQRRRSRESKISAPDLEPLRRRSRSAFADSVYDFIELSDVDVTGARHAVACLAVQARPASALGDQPLSDSTIEAFHKDFARAVRRLSGVTASRVGPISTALFGYPHPLDDDVQHALSAALSLLRDIGGHNDTLSLGVGLAYGEVVLPESDLGASYGRPLDRALQLAAEAADQRILVDRSVRSSPSTVELAPTGRDGVFEPDFDAAGMPSPMFLRVRLQLLERGDAVTDLNQVLDRVREGRATSCAIIAPDGYGKTRLLALLAREAERTRMAIVQAPAEPYPTARPGGVLKRLVAAALELVPADSFAEALAALQLADDEHLVLTRLLDDGEPPEGHAPHWVDALKVALGSLLRTLSRRTPLLVLCDRFDSVDVLSFSVIRHLTRRLGHDTRVGVVVAGTPAGHPARAFGEIHGAIRLEPLSTRSVEQLLMAAVPDLDAAVVARVVEMTEGAPGNLALLIEHLRSASEMNLESLPVSAMDVLARRLERLPENARKLLAIAGALGPSFPLEALTGAAPRSWDLRALLQLVGRVGLLSASEERGTTWLRFEPAELASVAVEQLMPTTRRQIHLRIARHFEQRREDEPTAENDFQWARQLAAAGQDMAAMRMLVRAAELALDAWGPLGARPLVEAALEATDALGSQFTDVVEQALFRLATVLVRAGEQARALPLLEAVDLSRASPALRARISWVRGIAFLGVHDLSAADEELANALVQVSGGDALTRARIHLARAQLFEARKSLDESVAEARRASAAAAAFDAELHGRDRELAWHPALIEARIDIFRKRYDAAAQTLFNAIGEARRVDDASGLVMLNHALAYAYRSMGLVDETLRVLEDAVRATHEIGDVRTRVRLLNDMATTYLDSKRPEPARGLLESSILIARSLGLRDALRTGESRLAQIQD